MRQLSDEPFFLQPIGAVSRHHFTQPYSPEAIKSTVAAGKGIGCLSKLAVEAELASCRIVELRPKGFKAARTFNIVIAKTSTMGASMRRFSMKRGD